MYQVLRREQRFEVVNDGRTELSGDVDQFVIYKLGGEVCVNRVRDFDNDADLLTALASRIRLD